MNMKRKRCFLPVLLLAMMQSVFAWDGSGTQQDPYVISNYLDWQELSGSVENGNSHEGQVFRLIQDIYAGNVSVGTADTPFRGIFDGFGYTINYNAGSVYEPVSSDFAAPFRYAAGATFRHLKTTGTIYTRNWFCAGIVARVTGTGATQLYDCHSSMQIWVTQGGNIYNGGLVGEVLTYNVNETPDSVVIDRCSFTGALQNRAATSSLQCGGFVGLAEDMIPVTIRNSVFDPQDWTYHDIILDGATFANMVNPANLTLENCYATIQMNTEQGTFILNDMMVPDGATFRFVGEPDVTLNGKGYWTNGCYVELTLPDGTGFNHWVDQNGCFISDPWTANGKHQLLDLSHQPIIMADIHDIPTAETERTYQGVKYRYLSRKDYHFFISDEELAARGWEFESNDADANLIVKTGGEPSEITAITGYDESGYDNGTAQIRNDLVGAVYNHTHLGLIAPHAFRGSTQLTSLYFMDTDANLESARTQFKFTISEGAFEGCVNFKEMKMMQYTTEGDNHWEPITHDQVTSIAGDAFNGCTNLKISVQADKYQSYLSSTTWQPYHSRFIIYEASTADFTVNGVKYRWFRSYDQTQDLKNDDEGKRSMTEMLRTWNADYQQFRVSSLLDTKEGCNVYYASITGIDDSGIDSEGGTMKIFNDPGSYYNYKTIQLQRDAIAGNTHVRSIEFWQTNGRSENSFSDLKMVIPNGAFKGCTNLKELRMFYYVQDGDDRWMALGPKDVIPGDNIFGEPSIEQQIDDLNQVFGDDPSAPVTEEKLAAVPKYVPEGFRILVATQLYQDFLSDPNWIPYISYIEPTEFMPQGKMKDFTDGGLTYSYMTAPGGISQASQVVSQDVSWWTAPRIGLEVLLYAASIYEASLSVSANASFQASKSASVQLTAATTEKRALDNLLNTQVALNYVMDQYLLNKPQNVLVQLAGKDLGTYGLNLSKSAILPLNSILDQSGRFILIPMAGLNGQQVTALVILKAHLSKAITNTLDKIALATKQIEAAQLILKETSKAVYRNPSFRSLITNSVLNTGMGATVATAGMLSSSSWGGSGTYNPEQMNKGMRENILSNIHQVGLVGGGYVITTPQKNLVFHTYIKEVANNVQNAVIHVGFDNDNDVNTSNRTMTFARDAFRGKTNLKSIRFHEISGQSSNTGMAMLLTIPDSAFVGCTALTEFSTLLRTDDNGTRALGPENFILAGDSIFAGLDSTTFRIIIDPERKQDFLDNASWSPLARYFKYESAAPAPKFSEYGARYAYAYEQNSIKKENKVNGHLIEHTIVTGPDNDFIIGHQGALKLCNDIGVYDNFQLDQVLPKAFLGNRNLRSVSFVDLYGSTITGDSYTGLQVHLGDSAFADCINLADLDLLYMETDGINHMTPMTPQMISIGNGVFDGTTARIKMMPQQVAWFEADSAWAKYKERFMPCVIRLTDPGIMAALKPMAYYDPANTGTDPSVWEDFADYARIGGAGFSWLDGRFTAQKDNIYSFADFRWFESVGLDYVGKSWFEGCSKLGNIILPATIKAIRSKAFYGCSSLQEIELPEGLNTIENGAFGGCTRLSTIVVRSETPAILGTDVFFKHDGLRIYVPAAKLNEYRNRWAEYAQYIIADNLYKVNKEVTVTAAGQLAGKLGLTLTTEGSKVHYISGPYAKFDSLTVTGPLNGEDLAVIRHLSGADAYNSDPTDGTLRYLNLWNVSIMKDTEHSYNGNWLDEHIDSNDIIPDYLFENCAVIEEVILPKSVKSIGENIFEEAYGLKRVCIGSKTTAYDSDILQDLNGIEELVFLTEKYAQSESSDPWEAPIQQVYTLPSQLGDYMGDPALTTQAMSVLSPMSDDRIMWALADAGHFFPSEYLMLDNVEGIFNGNTAITNLDDLHMFSNVKRLDGAFSGMSGLKAVTLPAGIESIANTAFTGCTSLDSISISCDSVPVLAADAFESLPKDFRILVPKSLAKRYREQWPQYADHINTDSRSYSSTEILTVLLTEHNTLADKLGLTITTKESAAFGNLFVNSLKGDYSKIYRLKVTGPVSGADLDVLRYLAGWCPWAHTRNYSGHLEYLDLYDADIVESNVAVRGYRRNAQSFMAAEEIQLYKVYDNILPQHALLRAYNLKTLILPRTCTGVNERALQECEGLETLVIGDEMKNFVWSALDDNAMLTRMYILATQKVEISDESPIKRWLCNNYNPTFDAIYVRPSLYEDYLYDDNYTGSSWQRTNNVSKGGFDDDDSFAAFAAHAAATMDDLFSVDNVDGWFDNHTGIKDLSALGYTIVSSLRADDMQKLTRLEKVVLPVTLESIEDSLFSRAAGLRYVDMLMCDSTLLVDRIKAAGLARLGIDTLRTLVYLPQQYGEAKGTNIVVYDGTGLHAETYLMQDGLDYCVPYAFEADKVLNSRILPVRNTPYTVCLPYDLEVPDNVRAYALIDYFNSQLVFSEIPAGSRMEAMRPYLIKVNNNPRRSSTPPADLGTTKATLPASNTVFGKQDDTYGYSVRGTLTSISNADAAQMGAYILQPDGDWHPVSSNTDDAKGAYVPAFRIYLLPSARFASPQRISIGLKNEDGEIETFDAVVTDSNGRVYDLGGRETDADANGIIIRDGNIYLNR